ncbi:MAG: pyridoxamine 5'-phosphate oxidase family protein [Nitrososphaerales archaeon]
MTDNQRDVDAGVAARIRAFLAQHTTLSLATVSLDGKPAAAAVFYAAGDALDLYFLSEERTEHGQNLLRQGTVAGTIQADGQDWRTIRGLQLRGHARIVNPDELVHATAIYARRFGFVAGLVAGQSGPGVLSGPLARARFWILQPTWLRLIDNTVRFGHKEELLLDETR